MIGGRCSFVCSAWLRCSCSSRSLGERSYCLGCRFHWDRGRRFAISRGHRIRMGRSSYLEHSSCRTAHSLTVSINSFRSVLEMKNGPSDNQCPKQQKSQHRYVTCQVMQDSHHRFWCLHCCRCSLLDRERGFRL